MLKILKHTLFIILFTTNFVYSNVSHDKKINELAKKIEQQVINWRHDIHQNPELSNREFNTAKKVTKHMRSLGIEVFTNVAHTGVVGILKGGKPGRTVALRADMDALPVVERVNIPFASKVKTIYKNKEVDGYYSFNRCIEWLR